jgi:hypothetical protein
MIAMVNAAGRRSSGAPWRKLFFLNLYLYILEIKLLPEIVRLFPYFSSYSSCNLITATARRSTLQLLTNFQTEQIIHIIQLNVPPSCAIVGIKLVTSSSPAVQ